jgi:hypothetical protein
MLAYAFIAFRKVLIIYGQALMLYFFEIIGGKFQAPKMAPGTINLGLKNDI